MDGTCALVTGQARAVGSTQEPLQPPEPSGGETKKTSCPILETQKPGPGPEDVGWLPPVSGARGIQSGPARGLQLPPQPQCISLQNWTRSPRGAQTPRTLCARGTQVWNTVLLQAMQPLAEPRHHLAAGLAGQEGAAGGCTAGWSSGQEEGLESPGRKTG